MCGTRIAFRFMRFRFRPQTAEEFISLAGMSLRSPEATRTMRTFTCICLRGTYRADVYYEDYTYKSFDVVVTPEGSTVHEEGFVQMYQITTNLTGLTSNAPETVEEGKALSFTMSPEKGFGLPLAIQVTMGGQNLLAYQYSYDPESGLFALESVTGDVVITAEGVSGIQTFPVVAQLQHMTYNGPDYASIGKTVIGTLIPDAGYALPEVISVTMGGQATEHYTYDPAAGTVTVTQVTGDVVISGAATLIGGRTITYQLTHLTHNGPTEYVAGQDLTMYLTPDAGYFLPETVSVTGDQEVIRYTYNPNTGRLTIWNATGNLTIQAEAQSDAPAEVAVAINPTELTVDNKPGLKGQFTAIVTGAEDVTVAWSLSGNTSDETRVEAGQLFLGADETAKTLTVTATANADPSKSASAVVYGGGGNVHHYHWRNGPWYRHRGLRPGRPGHPGDLDRPAGNRLHAKSRLPADEWDPLGRHHLCDARCGRSHHS